MINDIFKFAQVNSLKFHSYKAVIMRKLPQNNSGLETIIKVSIQHYGWLCPLKYIIYFIPKYDQLVDP